MSDDWEVDSYDDESLTVPCPGCGADVYEDAEQCPVCGDYVIHRHSATAGMPAWMLILGILGVLAVIISLFAAF